MFSEIDFFISRLNFISIIDILLVALVFYWILTLLQGTRAVQLLRGILIISILAVISASVLNQLTAFSWLVDKALPALLVAIPIIFQPELRRALERLGRTGVLLTGSRPVPPIEDAIRVVGQTATAMSELRHGALIVFERDTGLEDHLETGVRVNAQVTPALLMTIFYPGTPLHDGAVVIKDDKIVAAAVVLPLGGSMTTDMRLLGTRHRAALGISETTDAIVVVVSEETGLISVVHDGKMIRGVDQKRLEQLLKAFFKNQLVDDSLFTGLRPPSLLRRLGATKPNVPNQKS